MNLQPFLFWVIGGLTAACAIATVVTHNIVRCATWLLFTLAGTSGLFFLIGADLVGAVQLLVYVGGTMVLVVFGVMLTAQGPFITMRTSSAEWGVSAAVGIAMFALLVLSFMTGVNLNPQPANEPNVAFAPKTDLVLTAAKDNLPENAAARSPLTMIIGQGFAGVGVGPAHKDPAFRPIPKPKPSDEPPLAKVDRQKLEDAAVEKAVEPKANEQKKIDAAQLELIKVAPMLGDGSPPDKAGIIRANYLFPFEIVSVHLLVVLIGAAYLARAKRREAKS